MLHLDFEYIETLGKRPITSPPQQPQNPAARMLSRPSLRSLPLRQLFQNAASKPLLRQQRRTLIAAPKEGSGPLMSRRSDRALPPLRSPNRWLRTLPIFAALMAACTLAIFNYQKSNSSVVSSALYSLRTNEKAREILGDEVYFAQQLPWIWGHIDQVHGDIDVSFMVKGTRGKAMMRFQSIRKARMGFVSTFFCRASFALVFWRFILVCYDGLRLLTMVLQFETTEWSLTPEGGETVSLLDGGDPFQKEE